MVVIRWSLIQLFLVLAVQRGTSFAPCSVARRRACPTTSPSVLVLRASSFSDNSNPGGRKQDEQPQSLESLQEKTQREALVKAKLDISEDLVPLEWKGTASLPTTTPNNSQTCLVLTANDSQEDATGTLITLPALVVPLDRTTTRLLEAAHAGKVLSPSVLLRLNAAAVNRDQGLFDNLPWATWTVDPFRRDVRDAAGNVINARFHMGKRDAYNVLLGKDWSSSSRGLRDMAQELRQRIDRRKTNVPDDDADDDTTDEEEEYDARVLARRLLELQIREAKMDLADCDYRIATAESMNESWTLEEEREILVNRVASLETRLAENSQEHQDEGKQESSQQSLSFVDRVLADWDTRPEAPYRGATGYAPKKDDSNGGYTSPYDMFRAILEDQLKAQVIGAVLENTSLLDGTTVLGGALVLRRITARKSTTAAGQVLSVSDEEEDYGNEGVTGGETIVVECDADEALGMSLACDVPLHVEQGIWERSSVMVQAKQFMTRDELIEWETVDPELSLLTEGQAGQESATERAAPLRSPRSTTSLFDAITRPQQATSDELFPTDNPIQSLNELDRLPNEDKARTLMSMSNFEGRLPRPRAVRQSEQSKNGEMNALDRLLVPLIDESVRRDYYIRQAVQNGDMQLAQELESSKSMRQITREKAERAKEAGEQDVAEYWEKEAELYASLRADVTQDEGSYSRFLDRDEWYERERMKSAERARKKYGNLLDGTE